MGRLREKILAVVFAFWSIFGRTDWNKKILFVGLVGIYLLFYGCEIVLIFFSCLSSLEWALQGM